MSSIILPVVLLIILLVFGVFFMVNINKQNEKTSTNSKEKKSTSSASTSASKQQTKGSDVPKEDVFKFMEFDKIMDNMIVQNNGQKYTMIVKCKGINYDLMSENEQLAVEEGFITFLNTLKFPIQLYVQAQNIDLKKTIAKYNENLQGIISEYDQANLEYNQVLNSLDSTKDEIRKADYNKKSVQNVLEYASDIVRYVERLSVNKSLLQRSFYVIISYYTSEITSISNFSKDEIVNICYNELYTRAVSIISALSSCSVNGVVLTSNELANLLYTSYNRDDAKYIDIQRALESGYFRLYSTSEDAFKKKEALLEEQINNEAQIKAYEAIKKAIETGEYQTPEMQQIQINEEISKTAIEIVRSENIDDDIKENAKDIIVDDYKKTKQKIIENASKAKAQKEASKEEKKDAIKEPQKSAKEEEVKPKEEVETKVIEPKVEEPIVQNVQDNKNDLVESVDKNEVKQEVKIEEPKQEIKEEVKVEEPKQEIKEEVKVEPKKEETNNNNNTDEANVNTSVNSSNNDAFEDDFFDSII